MSKGPTKQTKGKRKIARSNCQGEHIGLDWEGDIIYKKLPLAGDQYGWCHECGTTNNDLIAITITSGERNVFVCNGCGRLMCPLFNEQKKIINNFA